MVEVVKVTGRERISGSGPARGFRGHSQAKHCIAVLEVVAVLEVGVVVNVAVVVVEVAIIPRLVWCMVK